VPAGLLRQARAGFAAIASLRATAAGEYVREPGLPEDAGALADLIAGAAPAPPAELQQLLETVDVRRRLEVALALLEAAIAQAHRDAAASAAARWAAPFSSN
jgi:Lon protease-like protein